MVTTACPAAEELRNYTLGRLAEKDWEAITEHLESCLLCQAAIATVDDVADTLVTQLREASPKDSFVKESQCDAALKRARDIAMKKGTGSEIVGQKPDENEGSEVPVPLFHSSEAEK